jgi:hypothetical protein
LRAKGYLRGPENLHSFPGGPLTEGIVSSTSVRTGYGNGIPTAQVGGNE